MNSCETILKEIHQILRSFDVERPRKPRHIPVNLLNLVQDCLDSAPGPEVSRFLQTFRKELEQISARAGCSTRPFWARKNRELKRILSIQDIHSTAIQSVRSPEILMQPARYVKGVGERIASLLAKLGIQTVEDLLWSFPYRYEDRKHLIPIAKLKNETFVTVRGIVRNVDLRTTPRKRFRILKLLLEDRSGSIVAKWFNQDYLIKHFKPGQEIFLSGKVKRPPHGFTLEMENPEYEILQPEEEEKTIHTNRIVPIYHTTAGLSQRRIRTILFHLVTSCAKEMKEILPNEVLAKFHLPDRPESFSQLHFPGRAASVEQLNTCRSPFHKRMIFEEFFLLETLLAMRVKGRTRNTRGISFQVNTQTEKHLLGALPFPLTSAQTRVIREIKRDMGRPTQMSRLLQGDVGCGKTIVAAVTAGIALENGYQVAVMAPTEILAEQLYSHFAQFFETLGKKTALLTRMVKNSKKETIRNQVCSGEIDVVLGTQALIQKEVRFNRLGLVIIDEQHRFGVIQRAALMQKGLTPDVLVMTATPIPRSLSLTLYGDLEISVIDEMPEGRSPVKTEIIRPKNRNRIYHRIEREVRKGHQAYIVYPLVEETEKSDLAAASEMSEHLSARIFPEFRVGLLHGRMRPEEKEDIMNSFKKGKIQILVSTTVVEVGIDIPNATIMVIEHAERFGLAQLHQLRGRVGRGGGSSSCFLIPSGRMTPEASKRLSIMEQTTDGFLIAEEDLAIRGPGEFFGKKQSGMPNFLIGNIVRDARILEIARREAFPRVEKDPFMENPENRLLKFEIRRRFEGKEGLIRVG